MATRNPLTQTVVFDNTAQRAAYEIVAAVGTSWYLLRPWVKPSNSVPINPAASDGRLVNIQQLQRDFTGFESTISYANRNRP